MTLYILPHALKGCVSAAEGDTIEFDDDLYFEAVAYLAMGCVNKAERDAFESGLDKDSRKSLRMCPPELNND